MPEEFKRLLNSIEVAENKLNYAISKYEIDAAIFELTAAELRLQAYIVSQKTA